MKIDWDKFPRYVRPGELSEDKSINECVEAAKQVTEFLARYGVTDIEVWFEYTCSHCGARITFDKPNTLYTQGICGDCGKTTNIEKAAFAVLARKNG